MGTAPKCLLSALAGAVMMYAAVGNSHGSFGLAGQAEAQEGTASTENKASGSVAAPANVAVEIEGVMPVYANFARVSATPEEVIIDFGLNPDPYGAKEQRVKASQRVLLNFFTTKRLLIALQRTITRHEDVFGPIEIDVRKRTRPAK